MKKLKDFKKSNDKLNKFNMLLFSLIFIITLFFTVGYSALNQNLTISGEVNFRPNEGLRVTDFGIYQTINSYSNYESYTMNSVSCGAELYDLSSAIGYNITLTNFGNVAMNISNVNVTLNNPNLMLYVAELEHDEYGNPSIKKLYEDYTEISLMPLEQKTITLIITYHNSVKELPEQTSFSLMLTFEYAVLKNGMLAKGSSNSAYFFNGEIEKTKVESINISENMYVDSNAIYSWDASFSKNGGVVAYVTDYDDDGLYELVIGSNGKVIAPDDCSYLFSGFTNANSINFNNNLDTSKVKNMSYMFSSSGFDSLDLDSLVTLNVTDMSYMFYNLASIKNINLSSFNTSNVENMECMFALNTLTSVDLSNFDTRNVTNMYGMFGLSVAITNLNLSNFNTSKVTNMSSMFSGCIGLTSLDLSNFNTSNVTDMSDMFIDCAGLIRLDLSNFNTYSLTNMRAMFTRCTSLTELNLSNINIINVTTNINNIFNGCDNLVTLTINNGKFYNNNITFSIPKTVVNLNMKNIDFSSGTSFKLSSLSNLEYVDMENFIAGEDMFSFFSGCVKLKNINFKGINVSKTTNMSSMFKDCNSLTGLDLTNFDTSNVIYMSSMFDNCSSLTSLDLTNFDTSKVNFMSGMFYNCKSLTSLDISNFITSKVSHMDLMFDGCSSLTTLDLSKFNTSAVMLMSSMFNGCSSLTTLDLSNFDTANVTNMSSMFAGCSSLTTLDLSDFDTANVTNMFSMFNGCENLAELDVRNMVFVKSCSDVYLTCNNSVFESVNSAAKIIVKDEIEQAWILNNSELTDVVIA